MRREAYSPAPERVYADRSSSHYPGGDPAGKMSSSAGVLESVVLHVCGIVGMRRSRDSLGIVRTAYILVGDAYADRGSGRESPVHSAQYRIPVLLDPRCVRGSGGTAAGKLGIDEGGVHAESGREPVQHGTYRWAVALTEDGELHAAAYRVLHNILRRCLRV